MMSECCCYCNYTLDINDELCFKYLHLHLFLDIFLHFIICFRMQAPELSSLSATKQFESKKAENIINKIVIQILDSSAIIQNKTKNEVYRMSDVMKVIKY